MPSPTMISVTDEFLHKIDTGLSERRLLEEIGQLSCDELATALVVWSRRQAERPIEFRSQSLRPED